MFTSHVLSSPTFQPKRFTHAEYNGVPNRCNLWKRKAIDLYPKKMNTWNVRVSTREPLSAVVNVEEQVEEEMELDHGLGIVSFIKEKVFLITGATGSVGKILVEKILRTVPDVGKIYILIREENKEAAMLRIEKEIINTELFKTLKETHGESYHKFIFSKLVPVLGDMSESSLGIEGELADKLAKEVDVIINSGANTVLDERYDVSLAINTLAPSYFLKFAKRCTKLKLFLHLSTAYVNGEREGILSEKPFYMGDSIAKEKVIKENSVGSFPVLDVEAEIKIALDARTASQDNRLSQTMKDLGMERAKIYGWQNTYLFTKAMGEMMITSQREEIPVVIIRPSVIESTCTEPIQGWIEGIRVLDPILIYYAKGELTGFPIDVNGVIDVIPADMVVNAVLAASVKHASKSEPGVTVYHVCSSVANPLLLRDMFHYYFEYYNASPYLDSNKTPINVQKMKLFNTLSDFNSHTEAEAARRNPDATEGSMSARRVQKLLNTVKKLAKLYVGYMFYKGRFDNSNTAKLVEEMCEEERMSFGCDVNSINWKDYTCNVHIPGVMTHLLKGRGK